MTDDRTERMRLSVGVVETPAKEYGCGDVATLSRTVASRTCALTLTTLLQLPTASAERHTLAGRGLVAGPDLQIGGRVRHRCEKRHAEAVDRRDGHDVCAGCRRRVQCRDAGAERGEPGPAAAVVAGNADVELIRV